jgi:hypothetical protein
MCFLWLIKPIRSIYTIVLVNLYNSINVLTIYAINDTMGRRDCIVLDLQLHVESMLITTKVLSSNPAHGETQCL